jgi:hypothetical protein
MHNLWWRRERSQGRTGWQRRVSMAAGVLLALTTCGCAAKQPEGPPPWAAPAQQANAAASRAEAAASRAEAAAARAEAASSRVEAAATRIEDRAAQMETHTMSRMRK